VPTIELPSDLAVAHALIEELHEHVHDLRDENEVLRDRLEKMSRRMYGKSSELLDASQRLLAFAALEREAAAEEKGADKEESDAPEPKPTRGKNKKQRRHDHGRAPLPAHLPRDEQVIEPEDTTCPCCSQPMKRIGEETAEQLEYVPASYRVTRTIRPKYACGTCKEGVAVALAPSESIPRSKAGPGLLAHVVVSKYADHLPLYRQCEMLAREGITLSDSTLGGWIRQVSELLRPVAQAQWRSILDSHVLGADETTIRYLTPGKRGSSRGYLWAYRGDRDEVNFDFAPGRGGEVPLLALRDYEGAYLQVDGYVGYDPVVKLKAGMTRAGCWAHLRRKFHEAKATSPDRALLMLALIGQLYDIERELKDAEFEREDERRAALGVARTTRSRLVLDAIKEKLDEYSEDVLPKSPIGGAVGYAQRSWQDFEVYLEDPAIPIDNNRVEREMRAVAVGRKNWMFCGSRTGGKQAALLFGLIGTCKLQGVNPEAWLQDVLRRVRRHPKDSMSELTPRIWKTLRGEAR